MVRDAWNALHGVQCVLFCQQKGRGKGLAHQKSGNFDFPSNLQLLYSSTNCDGGGEKLASLKIIRKVISETWYCSNYDNAQQQNATLRIRAIALHNFPIRANFKSSPVTYSLPQTNSPTTLLNKLHAFFTATLLTRLKLQHAEE